MDIYEPAEDSYLLSETLKKELAEFNRNAKILDMGSGSGIQAETCRNMEFKNIVCADINKKAVLLLKEKGFKAIYTDLFSSFKINNKFDIIIFNPPYLSENKYDNGKDTTGGKKGYETILKFLKQAKSHLTKHGRIFLLYSSLSKPKRIKTEIKKLNYKFKSLNHESFFFETLYTAELSL